jgi:hypothetical protein
MFIAVRRPGVKPFFERGFCFRRALDAAVKTQPLPETESSLPDQWQRRLFLPLCRRYGLEPYRYEGQRYAAVVARRAPLWIRRFGRNTWLYRKRSYLNEGTERINREKVYKDAG